MGNVEIEIYMSNFIGFFKKNPEQLQILIGKLDSEIFYNEIRNLASQNLDSEKEVAPTRQQMIDLLVSLNSERKKEEIKKVVTPFMNHHMGQISMN